MINKVYLVGAGPGRPDLITVRGREILRQADVVIYDYLVNKKILDEAKEGAELICCDKLGKNRYSDGFLIHNERINQLVIKKAKQGKRVIRLKNGDVSIFSRFSQELDALVKEKIEFEIVPGVTAASAASCFTGVPLTDRRFASACVFVTGHEDPQKSESALNWRALVRSGTLVLYMAVQNLNKIVDGLLGAGKDKQTAVAIIQDASLLTQRILIGALGNIVQKAKEQKVTPPAVIIIGEVVSLEKDFNWLRKNKRILFTGLSNERFWTKAAFFHLPLIKIEPIQDYAEFDNCLKKIAVFDWIVFTSRFGAEYFFNRLKTLRLDARILKGISIAAIGRSTKTRLEGFGVLADLAPTDESSKGLLEEFRKIDLKNKKIFLPRSDISDKGLESGFKNLGAYVSASVAYKNVMPKDLPDLDLNFFDEIMFSSPSGVRNFVKRYGKPPKKVKSTFIGEVTKKEAKRYGIC